MNYAHDSKAYRVYSTQGKSVTLCGNAGGGGSKCGIYAVPLNTTVDGKAQCIRSSCYKDGIRNLVGNDVDRRTCVATPAKSGNMNAYEVKDGFIEIKGKSYPIRLADGFYQIRKLSVVEASRLMTMPDDYCRAVSNSQALKCLGNGWVSEIIIHLLSYALRGVPKDEPIICLSMYDGISTGRYCFDMLGYHNIRYYSYEIDKYAIKVSLDNYPDVVQCGDAFKVREEGWESKFAEFLKNS